MEDADCGAACLAMVLGSFGKRVELGELRDMTGASRDGVTALSIVHAARVRDAGPGRAGRARHLPAPAARIGPALGVQSFRGVRAHHAQRD
jgi:hypothetical protein